MGRKSHKLKRYQIINKGTQDEKRVDLLKDAQKTGNWSKFGYDRVVKVRKSSKQTEQDDLRSSAIIEYEKD